MEKIFKIIRYIWKNRWMLRSLMKTIYINFHYLPFKQAVLLPIWLYKPKFLKLTGKIIIDSDNIWPGMIKLGSFCAGVYPNDGICLEISGNVTFNGLTNIGNHSFLTIDGNAVFGENFMVTAALKLICYNSIVIDNNVNIGWNCMICDNDFHVMQDVETNEEFPVSLPIKVGHHVWIANNSTLVKGAIIPPFTTVASHSLVNKSYVDIPKYSIIAGSPAVVKRIGVARKDFLEDII